MPGGGTAFWGLKTGSILRKIAVDLRKIAADLRKIAVDLRKIAADLRKIAMDLLKIIVTLRGTGTPVYAPMPYFLGYSFCPSTKSSKIRVMARAVVPVS
jgi:hypothetical protein